MMQHMFLMSQGKHATSNYGLVTHVVHALQLTDDMTCLQNLCLLTSCDSKGSNLQVVLANETLLK